MSPTLRLIDFVITNGNRKSGLISLRKADKSGCLKFLLICTFVMMNGKGNSGVLSLASARLKLL